MYLIAENYGYTDESIRPERFASRSLARAAMVKLQAAEDQYYDDPDTAEDRTVFEIVKIDPETDEITTEF